MKISVYRSLICLIFIFSSFLCYAESVLEILNKQDYISPLEEDKYCKNILNLIDNSEGTINDINYDKENSLSLVIQKQGRYGLSTGTVLKIATKLIEKNININNVDSYGNTPIFYSCMQDSLSLTQLLLDNGAITTLKNNENKYAYEYLSDKERNKKMSDKLKENLNIVDTNTVDDRPIAEAFGIPAGISLAELSDLIGKENIVDLKKSFYSILKVPKTNRYFEVYYAIIDDEYGLVKFIAATRENESSAFGDELKNDFNKIKDLVTQKYGIPKFYDYLKAGSYWDSPQYYMMSIYKKDRILSANWENKAKSKLPYKNIDIIGLTVDAPTLNSYKIEIAYEFSNFDKYYKKASKTESDSF